MKHIPEPWRSRDGCVMARNPEAPEEFTGIADCRTVDVTPEQAQANALRIARCVNALIGFNTASLGNGVFAEFMGAVGLLLEECVSNQEGPTDAIIRIVERLRKALLADEGGTSG